jgi:hypothetical protein
VDKAFLEDFSDYFNNSDDNLTFDVRPVITVSIERLEFGAQSQIVLTKSATRVKMYPGIKYGQYRTADDGEPINAVCATIPHNVNVELMLGILSRNSRELAPFKKYPALMREINRIFDDITPYRPDPRVGSYLNREGDVWGGKHSFRDNLAKLSYLNPAIIDKTERNELRDSSWGAEYIWLSALDVLANEYPDIVDEHLKHTVILRTVCAWLTGLQHYLHLRHVITQFQPSIVEIYRSNLRHHLTGAKDFTKVKSRLKAFLRREAVSVEGYENPDFLTHDLLMLFVELKIGEVAPSLPSTNDGIAFEREILVALKGLGFAITPTPVTGDFGVDLLAEFDDLRFAIQCKDTAKPVGIKAVQEATSGRKFYKCDYAVVVARNGFTAAATELAVETGTMLVLPTQLSRLTDAL